MIINFRSARALLSKAGNEFNKVPTVSQLYRQYSTPFPVFQFTLAAINPPWHFAVLLSFLNFSSLPRIVFFRIFMEECRCS